MKASFAHRHPGAVETAQKQLQQPHDAGTAAAAPVLGGDGAEGAGRQQAPAHEGEAIYVRYMSIYGNTVPIW